MKEALKELKGFVPSYVIDENTWAVSEKQNMAQVSFGYSFPTYLFR